MPPKTFVSRPINDVSDFNYQVDIIVPFHGQYEKVTRLVESIYRCTRSNFFQLCLVDDCSLNEDYLIKVAGNIAKTSDSRRIPNNLHPIRMPEQVGFASALKMGFERTESPFVCLMNSDCVVEDGGWLRALGEALLGLKEQGVRMVSPMTNNPVGGDPAQKGERSDFSHDHVILEDDSHLSMYCVLCHRQLFARCGGFLKEYPFGYYEDEEFAGRMRQHGFKQAVCRNSWVQHDGMSTINPLWRKDPSIRNIMEEENRERCIADMKR
jgi:GT2 family glycosyltransferase